MVGGSPEYIFMTLTIVGVDCATDPTKVGLALGTFSGAQTTLEQVRLGSRVDGPAEIIVEWVQHRGTPVLLALDAPLGWPGPLAGVLANHYAGADLDAEAHDLFRRATDRFIKQRIGRQPLDVGADRIARTAHAALTLLGNLRQRLNEPIPLAWNSNILGTAAIEVYPAATLSAHEISALGYKQAQGIAARERVLRAVGARLKLSVDLETMKQNADALDAGICVLAAHDFLTGQAFSPPEPRRAEREGWIWVRRPSI